MEFQSSFNKHFFWWLKILNCFKSIYQSFILPWRTVIVLFVHLTGRSFVCVLIFTVVLVSFCYLDYQAWTYRRRGSLCWGIVSVVLACGLVYGTFSWALTNEEGPVHWGAIHGHSKKPGWVSHREQISKWNSPTVSALVPVSKFLTLLVIDWYLELR